MNDRITGIAMSLKKDGYTPLSLSRKEICNLVSALGNSTKKALVCEAIAHNQGMRTNAIRDYANCSNVPNAAQDANKVLLNHGLMIICVQPPREAYNAGFHYWYLVQAPTQYISVKMAMNDPHFDC